MLVVIEIQINKYRNIRILTALNNYYQVFLDTHTKITIYLVIHKQITLKNNKKQNKIMVLTLPLILLVHLLINKTNIKYWYLYWMIVNICLHLPMHLWKCWYTTKWLPITNLKYRRLTVIKHIHIYMGLQYMIVDIYIKIRLIVRAVVMVAYLYRIKAGVILWTRILQPIWVIIVVLTVMVLNIYT